MCVSRVPRGYRERERELRIFSFFFGVRGTAFTRCSTALVVVVAAGVSATCTLSRFPRARHHRRVTPSPSSPSASRARGLKSKGALVFDRLSLPSSVAGDHPCGNGRGCDPHLPPRRPSVGRRRVVTVTVRGADNLRRAVTGSGDDGDGEVPLSWYPPGLQEWEREVKEGSRKYRITSFTPDRWAAHRSSAPLRRAMLETRDRDADVSRGAGPSASALSMSESGATSGSASPPSRAPRGSATCSAPRRCHSATPATFPGS